MIARLAIVFALTLAAPALAADADKGQGIAEDLCNACHIVQQKDSGRDDGEPAPRFSLLTKHSVESVTALLRKGHAQMDGLKKTSDIDIADMVAHLKRLKPELR